MKKSAIFAWALLCTLPLFFSFTNADTPPVTMKGITVKVEPVENKKAFKLFMYNLQKKPVRVLIQDLQGETFYSEKILDHNGYRQLINLKNLRSGEYVIRILHPIESKFGIINLRLKGVDVLWNEQELSGVFYR